jgi:hypothetical protein
MERQSRYYKSTTQHIASLSRRLAVIRKCAGRVNGNKENLELQEAFVVSTKYSLELKGYCNSASGKRMIVRALNKGQSSLKVYSLRESAVKEL